MTANSNEVRVPSVLMDLIPQYIANRKSEVKTLTRAIAEEDFTTIQNIGHKLKGNAGSYGFNLLSDIGSTLEKAGKERDLGTARELVENYDNYINNVYVIPA